MNTQSGRKQFLFAKERKRETSFPFLTLTVAIDAVY